ncbi:MAG: MmgE/PrpD family protein [Pseudomonadota bacterium]
MSLPADNPARLLARHVAEARYGNLGAKAVERTSTFLLDTIGVGIAGSSGANVPELISLVSGWGAPGDESARVLVSGERLPVASAAILNAYQIHSLEFDCVLEEAVVHPMATLLSATLAHAERRSAAGNPVTGRDFVTALNVGVDVAAMLGRAGTGPIRFFRPATCGGFGTVAALAFLEGFDEQAALDAFGMLYGQTSGTLQPHSEGSPLLGLQIGFNARAALCALDLARAGIKAPNDVITGPYGYLRMMEEEFSLEPFEDLGNVPQMTRMSHKPFPSGRLTHGVVHALRDLTDRGILPEEIERIAAHVPPLVHRLVGRPDIPAPEANYAKLCLEFIAGSFLAHGTVDLASFQGTERLEDPRTHLYAALVDVILDDNPDPNALDPQRFVVRLKDGREITIDIPHMVGHPAVPLSADENEEKFRAAVAHARRPLSSEATDRLVRLCADPAALDDSAALVDAAIPS